MENRASQVWAFARRLASVRRGGDEKKTAAVNWHDTIYQVIDFSSFSSVWYWIGVAVLWSTVSHWVLGVPFDLITRARARGGQAEADLHALVRINVNRLVGIGTSAGLVLVTLTAFLVTLMAVLGFVYGLEMAQAIFLMLFPLSLVGLLSFHAARRIAETEPQGEALFRALSSHRIWTQVIGMIAIFITAVYGMIQNLDVIRNL